MESRHWGTLSPPLPAVTTGAERGPSRPIIAQHLVGELAPHQQLGRWRRSDCQQTEDGHDQEDKPTSLCARVTYVHFSLLIAHAPPVACPHRARGRAPCPSPPPRDVQGCRWYWPPRGVFARVGAWQSWHCCDPTFGVTPNSARCARSRSHPPGRCRPRRRLARAPPAAPTRLPAVPHPLLALPEVCLDILEYGGGPWRSRSA